MTEKNEEEEGWIRAYWELISTTVCFPERNTSARTATNRPCTCGMSYETIQSRTWAVAGTRTGSPIAV